MRLIQRFALVVFRLVVCAAITSPAWSGANLLTASTDAAGLDLAHDARGRTVLTSTHHWRDGARRRAVDLNAVEADLEEEDEDRPWDVPEQTPRALPCAPLARKSERTTRGEAQSDTSRFAVETGLPRGPPSA